MARRVRKPKPCIYQLHIALKDMEAPVWRRVLVRSDARLDAIHFVLNEAMGWNNSHLHLLVFDKRTFANPDIDEGTDFEDERAVCLDELVGVGDRFSYHYNFGDDWMHQVRVEKKLPIDDRFAYPVCVGGARACPPEDCGGALGYERLLSALLNDDDDELVGWVGGFYDPEGFDVNRTNQRLREFFRGF